MPVKFTLYSSSSRSEETSAAEEPKVKKDEPEPICPSCKKKLSNSILIFRESLLLQPGVIFLTCLLVAKPCAHVTCKTCTDTLVRPAKQCIVCSTQLKEKDILELKREG